MDHVNDCRKILQQLNKSLNQGSLSFRRTERYRYVLQELMLFSNKSLRRQLKSKTPMILQLTGSTTNIFLDEESTDDVPVVLSVYEFDAKANLNHEDVECLLDKISKLPNTDGKTFETIAGNKDLKH